MVDDDTPNTPEDEETPESPEASEEGGESPEDAPPDEATAGGGNEPPSNEDPPASDENEDGEEEDDETADILERLIPTNITEVMQTAYIDYSMSVIISRALPDARDGFKPVQRRILYAMLREGLVHNRNFDKCAGVVGEVLKNYHPHGDASVYDTLVRLAQPWVMRYPLIEGQGNFGSIDGDPAAAYRYTECRLFPIAEEMLRNIDEDTVDYVPNYKESTTEPSVLPASVPNLLINGSTGIAVGMTTNIPPHNLSEVIDATCAIIDNPSISLDELIEIIPGPDFPTGGTVGGKQEIEKYLKTGRGILRTRGTCEIEELPNDKEQIIITETPYNVNRATLVTKIAYLVNQKEIEGVSDLRDESDENTRIVVELKRGEIPRVIINQLYKMTQLESSFGVILLALDKRRPKQMNIKEIIQCYIEHRREVIFRRTQFQLKKAEDRAHILEGYLLALDNLDEIVKIIRASQNRDDARTRLMERFPFSERQTNAILDLRLYQLTGLEREKIEGEYEELQKLIARLREILENEGELLGVIKTELKAIQDKYGTARRSIVSEHENLSMEDLIPREACLITVTHNGFIKRTSIDEFRAQKRGGVGVKGAGQYEDDFIEQIFSASTHDFILFFMNNGRLYVQKVYDIPEGSRISKGRAINNLLEIQKGEKIAAMICVEAFEEDGTRLVFCTKKGIVKKTSLFDYKNFRRMGTKGINIDEDDELLTVRRTRGDDSLIIVTRSGQSVRFHEDDLRKQGRVTRGVIGIRFKGKDEVKAMEVVDPESTLLMAGTNGMGKRTVFDEYRIQKRGGTGIIAMKTRIVAGALNVTDDDEIMMFTKSGQAVRSPVKDVRVIGRTTQGVRLINLREGDRLIGISKVLDIKDEDEEPNEDEDGTEQVEDTDSASNEENIGEPKESEDTAEETQEPEDTEK
ncbi:MAG: DNA gyrase subunit A [Opitutae bacterium]|jgi:DNA gyrase subunit A|nr:DNA gyrase subunit A [Opitutae bacterium]MBT5380281.1 DNA gyrase subunit A [Opitutae bacterium]MBT6463635.1 DNA gyrase subunit A [Opitutae bacterium]